MAWRGRYCCTPLPGPSRGRATYLWLASQNYVPLHHGLVQTVNAQCTWIPCITLHQKHHSHSYSSITPPPTPVLLSPPSITMRAPGYKRDQAGYIAQTAAPNNASKLYTYLRPPQCQQLLHPSLFPLCAGAASPSQRDPVTKTLLSHDTPPQRTAQPAPRRPPARPTPRPRPPGPHHPPPSHAPAAPTLRPCRTR